MQPPLTARRLNHHRPARDEAVRRAGREICLAKTQGTIGASKEQIRVCERSLPYLGD
jgi:hypothetical protein